MSGFLIEHLKDPDGRTDVIFSIAFSSNGEGLVSGRLNHTINMWQPNSLCRERDSIKECSNCVKILQWHNDYVHSVTVSPDSLWIISGARDHSA